MGDKQVELDEFTVKYEDEVQKVEDLEVSVPTYLNSKESALIAIRKRIIFVGANSAHTYHGVVVIFIVTNL